jgi:hypothetical protein
MKANNYDSNPIKLQLLIENNMEKWEVLPGSACNHIYSKDFDEGNPKEDIVVQPNADREVAEVVTF